MLVDLTVAHCDYSLICTLNSFTGRLLIDIVLIIQHCRPLLDTQECATHMLFGDSELCDWSLFNPERSAQIRKFIGVANITVNYVCREHVDGNCLQLLLIID